MVTAVPLGGTYFGRVTEARIRLDALAVTRPGPDAVWTGTGARASTADIVLQNSRPGTPYIDLSPGELAIALLHELGHVFNIVTSLGGSAIQEDVNRDGSIDYSTQQDNAKRLENCRRGRR